MAPARHIPASSTKGTFLCLGQDVFRHDLPDTLLSVSCSDPIELMYGPEHHVALETARRVNWILSSRPSGLWACCTKSCYLGMFEFCIESCDVSGENIDIVECITIQHHPSHQEQVQKSRSQETLETTSRGSSMGCLAQVSITCRGIIGCFEAVDPTKPKLHQRLSLVALREQDVVRPFLTRRHWEGTRSIFHCGKQTVVYLE